MKNGLSSKSSKSRTKQESISKTEAVYQALKYAKDIGVDVHNMTKTELELIKHISYLEEKCTGK